MNPGTFVHAAARLLWPRRRACDQRPPTDPAPAAGRERSPARLALARPTTIEEVARIDMLREGWERVRGRSGFAGPDGETVPQFARSADRSLEVLSRMLLRSEWRPTRPLKLSFPKPSGGTRVLRVFNVRDRIVLQAVRLAMQPAVEAVAMPCSFAYRPGLCSMDAVRTLQRILSGSRWFARADVAAFFDHVRLDVLRGQLETIVAEKRLLDLLDLLLECGSSEPGLGLAQGSATSPLFSNLYLSEFDAGMLAEGRRLVRFGDDMVVGCDARDEAEGVVESIVRRIEPLGLELNRSKTIVAPVSAGLQYLGARFGPDGRVVGDAAAREAPLQATAGPDAPKPRRRPERWTGGVGRLVAQCTVLQGIERIAATTRHLRHDHRLIVLYTAGRMGDEGARYLHSVLSHCSDYRRAICDRRLAELDREHRPITCAKIREWLGTAGEDGLCACGRRCRTPLDGLREEPGAASDGAGAISAVWPSVVDDVFGDAKETGR